MRFAGEYERTLDAKNRIVMPPKLKECLDSKNFVLCCLPGEDFIRVYREDDWEELTDKHLFIDDGTDRTELQRYVFLNSSNCELDGQSRFVIQPKFVERTGIKKDVTLIGVGKRAEIWSSEKLAGHEFDYNSAKITVPF